MSGIGIVRMGGDACERAAVRAYDTVALKPWMAGAATGPKVATGSHTSPATSTAGDRGTVDRFYEAAIAAGGRNNGPPGIRPHYDPNYYGAFVFDPDGHNIEAVCRQPE